MPLNNILSGYQLSPEAEERFSKGVIQNIKGSVRVNLGSVIPTACLLTVLGIIVVSYCTVHTGLLAMLLLIAYGMLTFLILWYMATWRLDFDGKTGFLQYHTFFTGTKAYHVSEMMGFEVHTQRISHTVRRGYRTAPGLSRMSLSLFSDGMRSRRTLRVRELMQIFTPDGIITIPLSSAWLESKLVHGVGGYRDAEKLYTYLDLYRRYVLTDEELNMSVQPDENGLTAATRAAIAAHQEEQGQPASAFRQPEPPAGESIAALSADDLNPAALPKEHAPAPVLSIPDSTVPVSGIPETHIGAQRLDTPEQPPSAFPDPAQPKPPVDVDALFDQVLREHGKSRRK